MSTKHKPKYKRIAQLKTANDFKDYLKSLNVQLGMDESLLPATQSPYGKSFKLKSGSIAGNRFCILPMEGWDGTTEGLPSEYTRRRWRNFAISGAKLLWGCEAVAVRHVVGQPRQHPQPGEASRAKQRFDKGWIRHDAPALFGIPCHDALLLIPD